MAYNKHSAYYLSRTKEPIWFWIGTTKPESQSRPLANKQIRSFTTLAFLCGYWYGNFKIRYYYNIIFFQTYEAYIDFSNICCYVFTCDYSEQLVVVPTALLTLMLQSAPWWPNYVTSPLTILLKGVSPIFSFLFKYLFIRHHKC